MKLIGRTLIILLATLIVCGAAYAIEGGRASGPSGFPQRGSFQEQRGPGNLPTGTFRRPEGPGGRGDRGGSWLGGIFELLRSLLIVAVVAAISLPFVRLLQRRQGKEQLTDEPSPGD